MKAVILAGGEGRRLRPATFTVPKPLIEVDGTPILHIILRQLQSAGFTEVTLSLGYRAQLIEASFDDPRWTGLDLRFSLEHEPLGTAGPLGLLPPLEDSTLVMNADLLTDIDFADLWRRHKKSEAAATIALVPRHVDLAHGVVEVDGENRVARFREKPRMSFLASTGIYVLEPSVPRLLPPRTRYDMPALLTDAAARGARVEGQVLDAAWHDIGTPAQLAAADAALRADRARYLGALGQSGAPTTGTGTPTDATQQAVRR